MEKPVLQVIEYCTGLKSPLTGQQREETEALQVAFTT